MSYKAIHKFAHISAQKVRPFADIIRGQYALEAVDALKFFPNRGARMLEKVLKSAIANAEDRNTVAVKRTGLRDLRSNDGVFNITGRLESDIVTALLRNCTREARIIRYVFKRTRHRAVTKGYSSLKICCSFSEQIFIARVTFNSQL